MNGMSSMKKMLVPSLVALLSVSQLVHAQAYKCKQPNGALVFQDHPCQAGATSSIIDLPPAQGYSAGDSGQSIGSNGTVTPGNETAQETPGKKTEADNARAMAEKAVRCNFARQQLGVLKMQRPVYSRDSAGNLIFVENKDRPAEISAAEERVATACQ